MNNKDSTYLLAKLDDVAIKAGRKICEYKIDNLQKKIKADNTIVTEADIKAEQIICEALRKLTPHIPIIGEEQVSGDNLEQENDYFYLVDPLDGTSSYVKGSSQYTVNIALMRHKQPFLGVIYAPALGVLYSAMYQKHDESQNFLHRKYDNQKAEKLYPLPKDKKSATAIVSKLIKFGKTEKFLQKLQITHNIIMASSLKFCLIAEGKADIYPRFGSVKEWDTAAGHAIMAAVGGKIKNIKLNSNIQYAKTKYDYAHKEFVAYAPHMQKRLENITNNL